MVNVTGWLFLYNEFFKKVLTQYNRRDGLRKIKV